MTIKPDSVWDDFLAALAATRRGPDADGESLHAFRSDAARLRAWLRLSGRRVLDDDLHRLRRSAGPVREVDVALARGGPPEFEAWLVEERSKRRIAFVRGLSRPRFRGLLQAFPLLPAPTRSDAQDALARVERDVDERAKDLEVDAPASAFHRLRRALRLLRHVREWLDRDSKPLREPLDTLGDLNDDAAALRLVERCPAAKRLDLFRDELRERARKDHARALEACSSSPWRER